MDTQIHVMSLPTPNYGKRSWSTLINKIFKLALDQHYLFNRKNNSQSLYAKIIEIKMDAQSSKTTQQNNVFNSMKDRG